MQPHTKQSQTEVQASSILDRVIEQQAAIASRYKPVMTGPEMAEREKQIDYLVHHVMKEGVDFGWVPGTKPTKTSAPGEYIAKPTLFKAGAERACAFFGYTPRFEELDRIQEWTDDKYGEPLCYREYRCTLLKDRDEVGQGIGSASSWESKYRYRKGERECPECGKNGTIIKGKAEYGGGWLCFGKKGGCGAKFANGDEAIEGQDTEKVANPDIADIFNVVLKMGQKRSYVAATLTATGLSGRFTQDLEDIAPKPEREAPRPQTAPRPAQQQRREEAPPPLAREEWEPAPAPIAADDSKLDGEETKITFLSSIMDRASVLQSFRTLHGWMQAYNQDEGLKHFRRILRKHVGQDTISGLKKLDIDKLRAAAGEMWDMVALAQSMGVHREPEPVDEFALHMAETETVK